MKFKYPLFLALSGFFIYLIIKFDKGAAEPLDDTFETVTSTAPAFKKEELPSQWKPKANSGDMRISVQANKKGDTTYVVQRYTIRQDWKGWDPVKNFPSADKAMRYLRDARRQMAEGDSSLFETVKVIPYKISI